MSWSRAGYEIGSRRPEAQGQDVGITWHSSLDLLLTVSDKSVHTYMFIPWWVLLTGSPWRFYIKGNAKQEWLVIACTWLLYNFLAMCIYNSLSKKLTHHFHFQLKCLFVPNTSWLAYFWNESFKVDIHRYFTWIIFREIAQRVHANPSNYYCYHALKGSIINMSIVFDTHLLWPNEEESICCCGFLDN